MASERDVFVVKLLSYVVIFTSCMMFFASEITSQEVNNKDCVCVWYYLCRNGSLNRDGDGLIDARSSFDVNLIKRGLNTTCEQTGYMCCPLDQADMSGTTPPPRDRIEEDVNSPSPLPDEPSPQPVENVPELVDPLPKPVQPPPSPPPLDPSLVDPSPPPAPLPPEGRTVTEPPIIIHENLEPKPLPVIVPQPGCGVSRVTIYPRVTIQDDSVAAYAEFPWMLAILIEESPAAYRFHCGASLIHEQVALTAAHCLKTIDPQTLIIRAGEWNTQSTEEPQPHQDRRVRRVKIHPYYNKDLLFHDVALLMLDSPYNITDNVDIICLPQQNSVFDGAKCRASGWGKDASGPNGNYQHILQKTELPMVSHGECQSRLRETRLSRHFNLHPSFVCAGGELNKDVCKGDGGGPLVCPIGENRWAQVGIVSWGIGCGTTAPGVYTNVPYHENWIRREIVNFGKPQFENPHFDHADSREEYYDYDDPHFDHHHHHHHPHQPYQQQPPYLHQPFQPPPFGFQPHLNPGAQYDYFPYFH